MPHTQKIILDLEMMGLSMVQPGTQQRAMMIMVLMGLTELMIILAWENLLNSYLIISHLL